MRRRAMRVTAPFKITVCGIGELAAHCEAGVSHVVSILDPDWPMPSAFGAYGEHQSLELRFDDVIERALIRRPQARTIFVTSWLSVAT